MYIIGFVAITLFLPALKLFFEALACEIPLSTNVGEGLIIYPHAIIFGDIVLMEGTVIGAGSVVTRSTEKNSVYAGNPARRLK